MRICLQDSFWTYELRAWTRPPNPSRPRGERVYPFDEEEALALVRRLLAHGESSGALRPLLLELDATGGTNDNQAELLRCVARQIRSGEIVVERTPVSIMTSDQVELFDRTVEPQEFENQFEEEIRVIHEIRSEPPPAIVADTEPDELPGFIFDSEPDELPAFVFDSEPSPPMLFTFGSEPEAPTLFAFGSESESEDEQDEARSGS